MENAAPIAVQVDVPFPNGNEVASPEVLNYVERYQGFLRKTAEAILGLAQTLIEAEGTLDEVEFSIFLERTDLEKGGSTYSKLKKIGGAMTRFEPFVEKLPNTWTTIYELSKMEAADFDRVASSLNPFTTIKDIQGLLGRNKPSSARKVDFSLTVNELDIAKKSELYEEIKKLKIRFGFNLSTNQNLVDELKSLKLAKVA